MKPFFSQIDTIDAIELRRFVLTLAILVALLFGCVAAFILGQFLLWPWLLSALLLALYFINVTLLVPVYKCWMAVGQLMGHLIAQGLLFCIFFLLVTPMGLVLQLMRRGKREESVWVESEDTVKTDFPRPY